MGVWGRSPHICRGCGGRSPPPAFLLDLARPGQGLRSSCRFQNRKKNLMALPKRRGDSNGRCVLRANLGMFFFFFRGTVKKIIISDPIFLGLADVRPAGSVGFQGGEGPIFLCVSRHYNSRSEIGGSGL